ncbi:hypothetical protein DFJ63DRAFT_311166 [Scheffersomyces coipomensis]|uniref:uncharacterized protein n=1 Tax=Scheffersomyces coipomensis TaxID=1788519 RepID=UPI00315C8FAF
MLLNHKSRFLESSLLLLILTKSSISASWALSGCYPSSDVSAISYNNDYTFQSSGYCEQQCPNSRIAALIGGKNCYCGNDAPDISNQVDQSSNCNIPCQGYPYENCGGNGYYMVYVNADVQDSPESSSTTSTTSTSTSTTSTSTTSTSTTSSPTTSTTNTNTNTNTGSTTSQNKITLFSTVTTDPSGSPIESIVYKTITADPSSSPDSNSSPSSTSSTPTSSSSSSPSPSSSHSGSASHGGSKLSAGGIAGAAVGGAIGLGLLIGGLIFFLWRRRRNNDDDDYEDDEYTLSGAHMNEKAGGLEPPPPPMIGPNPFLLSAGYNHFDTSQQQQQQQQGQDQNQNHQHNYSSSSGTQSEDHDSYQGFAIINNGGSGQHSRSGSKIINHSNDPSLNSTIAGMGSPVLGDENNQIQHQFQQPEYGRRRLSNGSLPDMIARQPGSLKVVNN